MIKSIRDLFIHFKKVCNNIGFMFRYSWKLAKSQYFFAIISIITSSVQPLILLIVPAKIIDELTNECRWDVTFRLIVILIAVEGGISLINMAVSYFSRMTKYKCKLKNNLDYEKMWIRMKYEQLESSNVRDLGEKVEKNVTAIGFISTVSAFITNLIQLIGYTYIIATLHPVIIALIIVFIIVSSHIAKSHQRVDYEYQPILTRFSRKFNYLFGAMVNFDYGKEIRINNASVWLKNRFDDETDGYMVEYTKRQRRDMKYHIFSFIEAFAQTIVMYGYCAYKAVSGLITIGSFTLYLGAITAFTDSFTGMITKFSGFAFLSKYVDEYKKLVEISKEGTVEDAVRLPDHEDRCEIEFKNVSFKYPNTERFVLKNVNIVIHSGERLSIVGYNGAGKSTFIKLICRLYTPTEGTITFNGVDIQTIDFKEYRELISVVFQDYKLFSMTVQENVMLNRTCDLPKMVDAIDKSGLTEKIEGLPMKEQTQLGKQFDENGIEFSGGEGQKLACARAYYKDAPIVILDEPTASLDPIAESNLYERFNSIIQDKTAIYISHRLASVKFCDKVAVFSDGVIVEYGTHSELIEEDGVYAEMFTKQSEYYVETKGGDDGEED